MDMPSARALRALYPPRDEAFDDAVRRTLASLREDEEARTTMKRKLSMGVVFALVLTAALACAAVAAGLGIFGQLAGEYGGTWARLFGALEEKSDVNDESQRVEGTEDTHYPEVAFRVPQSYYDGEMLYLTYELQNAASTYDFSWRPTKEELSEMWTPGIAAAMPGEEGPTYTGDAALDAALMETARREGSAGAIAYQSEIGDGVWLSGTDEPLMMTESDDKRLGDGTKIGMRKFSELPEAAQNLDELPVDFRLSRSRAYWYFDGETIYMKSELDEQVRLTVTIPRSDAAGPRVLHAEREFERCRVEADVRVTELVIRTEVTVTSLTGEPVNGDDIRGGDLSYYTLYLDGRPAEGLRGEGSGFGTTVYEEIDEYVRPETMPQQLTLVPTYWNEEATDREERWEEAVVLKET